ncbi:MAG TPA: hypothetical protein VN764_13150 [Polyangiaceae bacterium]|nr:hypothetical protein [Polyangiaceae bacterium]
MLRSYFSSQWPFFAPRRPFFSAHRSLILARSAVSCAMCSACLTVSCAKPNADDSQAWEESCAVPAPTECPDPPPGYDDVAPIFDESCATCHTSDDPDGPWPFEEYADIVAWHADVRDEVLNCTMPPRDGEPLPPDQRQLLMEWIFCGMPR